MRMKSSLLALVISALLASAAAAAVVWSPSPAALPAGETPVVAGSQESAACADSAPAGTEESVSVKVPPGCCTSNCVKDRDCDPLCGKGNCVCLATSSCCRRCTY